MSDPVFDADAFQREGDRPDFVFRFGGEEYRLPFSPDVRAVSRIRMDNLVGAFEAILGAEQWARIEASQTILDLPTLKAILDAYAKHGGLDDLPNLPGSAPTSNGTGPSLRPTSPASTGSS